MTNEEATIQALKGHIKALQGHIKELNETIENQDKVIKALEQEPVLDKIKAEIEKLDYVSIEDGSDGYDYYVDRYDVLQIIDKYKESEV